MLRPNTNYLWQLLSASDGSRSDAFICTLEQFREVTVDMTDEEKNGCYVLVLADVSGPKPQDFVLRFPAYRVSTFLAIDFSIQTNEAQNV